MLPPTVYTLKALFLGDKVLISEGSRQYVDFVNIARA